MVAKTFRPLVLLSHGSALLFNLFNPNSPFCEILVTLVLRICILIVHQDNILRYFLITYLLENVLILQGETGCRSLFRIEGLNNCIDCQQLFFTQLTSDTKQNPFHTSMVNSLLHVSRQPSSTIIHEFPQASNQGKNKRKHPCQQLIYYP